MKFKLGIDGPEKTTLKFRKFHDFLYLILYLFIYFIYLFFLSTANFYWCINYSFILLSRQTYSLSTWILSWNHGINRKVSPF